MSALEAHEHIQHSTDEPVPSAGGEAYGAKIIPFPVAGVGEVALGSEIAVHQGSGSNRYLTRQSQTLSAPANSHEYNMRVAELRNGGGPL